VAETGQCAVPALRFFQSHIADLLQLCLAMISIKGLWLHDIDEAVRLSRYHLRHYRKGA
jgi:hypothetical protein